MKKTKLFLAAMMLTVTSVSVYGQWGGTTPTWTSGNCQTGSPSGTETASTAAMGPLYGSVLGTGYTGYNLLKDYTSGNWYSQSNGAQNGSSGVYGDLWGCLNFCTNPISGTGLGSQTFTDADIMNNVNFQVRSNGDCNVFHGNLNVNKNAAIGGGQVNLAIAGDGMWSSINANSNVQGLGLSSGSWGSYIQLAAANNADQGAVQIVCGYQGSGTTFWSTDPAIGWNPIMRLKPDGRVAIGGDIFYPTENLPGVGTGGAPNAYNLYVSKGILTEKVKVASSSDPVNWSDFVFAKDYNLMPLSKVADYVKANHHLPEIPSASEVAKDGIDLGSMDAKLLQKIEELTLYVLQQQKEIDELKGNTRK